MILAELPAMLAALESAFADFGVSRARIRAAFREAGRTNDWRQRRSRSQHAQYLASRVIFRWYHDPMYLDASGVPRAIKERGGAPSVSHLMSRCVPRSKLNDVRKVLRATSSISVNVDGTWTLKGAQVLNLGGELALQRLTGLLEAVTRMGLRNLLEGRMIDRRWFDQKAHVASIPDRYARLLYSKAEEQLAQPLATLSSWLERQSDVRGKRSMREIGIACFQYELPSFERPRKRRDRTKPTRTARA